MRSETDLPRASDPEQDEAGGVRRARLNLTPARDSASHQAASGGSTTPLNAANADRPHEPSIATGVSNRSHSNTAKQAATRTKRKGRLSSVGLSKAGQLTLADQRKLGARIYHLKSYTTVGKINRKFHQDKRQQLLRNILALVMLIVILVIIFVVYNPIRDIVDVRKMLGINSPFMSIPTETVNQTEAPPIFD